MKTKQLRTLLVVGLLSLATAITLTSCGGGGGGKKGGSDTGNDVGGNSEPGTQVVSGFAPRSLTGSHLYWYNKVGNKFDADFTTKADGSPYSITHFIWDGYDQDWHNMPYTYVRDGANEAHMTLTFKNIGRGYTIEFEMILEFTSKTRAEATIRGVDRKTDGYYGQYTYQATVIFDKAPKDY